MPKLRPLCLLNEEDAGGHCNSVFNSARLQTEDADPVKDEGTCVNASETEHVAAAIAKRV